MNDEKPLILAIDDSPANLLLLGMALQSDFELQIASSGAEGLALATQTRPDLILLDIMMPGMDGFEVCRQLKANPDLRDTPVVFVSALAEHQSEVTGFALGAADYITKPINVEIARHRINNLLEREALRKRSLAQRDQLQAMLNNDLVGIAKSAKRTLLWANPALENMLGDGQANELVSEIIRQAKPVLKAGDIFRSQIEHINKTGDSLWLDLSGAMLDSSSGECLFVFVDITARKRAEDALKQQLRFTAGLHQVAQVIIDTQDIGALLQQVSAIAGQTLGLDRVQVFSLSYPDRQVSGLHEWLDPLQPHLKPNARPYSLDSFLASAAEILKTRRYLSSHQDAVNPLLVADGSAQLLHEKMGIKSLLWYPFDWSDGACLLLALNQMTQIRPWTPPELDFLASLVSQVNLALARIRLLEAHQQELDHLAHYDNLTHLPNRALLLDRLRHAMAGELRHGKKLAVVFLDLDGFKAVNDTHGHETGDQLLITLAAVMKQSLREGDTLARMGGDEFVAVLSDLENADASKPVLARMLEAASQPHKVNGLVLQVSASAGVTCFPQAQAVDADQLLRQADQAMYRAKLAGKNRYCFFDTDQDGRRLAR